MIMVICFFGSIVAFFEMMLVWRIKPLYKFITETSYGSLIGIIMSILLSILVADMFGAAGTIAMGGAVLGTIITAIVYKLRLLEMIVSIVKAWRGVVPPVRNTIRRTLRSGYAVVHPIKHLKGNNPHVLAA